MWFVFCVASFTDPLNSGQCRWFFYGRVNNVYLTDIDSAGHGNKSD